ncbi:YdaU family protein [Nitrosomonas sp.]|uniref:YdaU family protein n=1 Tax=Nitrosomonas sp. TaxID=42353 RepID=UPI0025FC537A|nr:YdaU family protein [Nitrosomonas sp.]
MHYYQHNIGDYRRDTVHLSLLEHGVYRQLMDMYYLSESPIPKETQQVFRRLSARTQDEQNAVEIILNEFFSLTNDGWIHKRCDQEIIEYQRKANTSRNNGKKGGRPKSIPEPEKTQQVILGNPSNNQTEPERINSLTNKPIKNIKEKIIKKEIDHELKKLLHDVDDQVIKDFSILRKQKKAPITDSAVAGLRSEANKAGVSLEIALIECCKNGWQGFKAEWYHKAQAPPAYQNRQQLASVAARSFFENENKQEKCINGEVIDHEPIAKQLDR